MSKIPELIEQKTLFKSRIFKIDEMRVRFSNGVERHFEKICGKYVGAVLIIPMIDDDTFLLIREYAAASAKYVIGFPKGAIDDDEDLLETANRELMEEVGYGARTLTRLTEWSLSPAYFESVMQVVLAKNLYEKKLEGDEPEPIEVIPWKLNNIDALLAHPEFHESRSVAAVLLLERMRNHE